MLMAMSDTIHVERSCALGIAVELRVLHSRRRLFPDLRPAERFVMKCREGGLVADRQQERGEEFDDHYPDSG